MLAPGLDDEAPELLFADAEHALATWRSFFLLLLREHAAPRSNVELDRRLRAFGVAHPEGVGLLTIIEPAAPLPGDGSRWEIAQSLRGTPNLAAWSIVFEGSGFRAASVRGVVTGIAGAGRLTIPHRVHTSLGEGGLWMLAHLPEARRVRAAQLLRAVEGFRARVRHLPV
jgi:hypothetical protein